MPTAPEKSPTPAPSTPPLDTFQSKLRVYLRAGYPLLYLVTAEEDRAIELVNEALLDSDLSKRRCFVWSVSRGLCQPDGKAVDRKVADPKRILPFLLEQPDPGVYILEDFHFFIDEKS